jgi:hypothetical protein
MKILMTQRGLRWLGGTELVTIEVALELRRRGHEVAVYSPRIGDLKQTLLNLGVWVASSLAELPWRPDVIHGQHHLQAIAAITYFEGVPAVYYCHGVQPWIETPPPHPRIRHYIVMCEWMAPRMEPEFGIPAEKVVVIPSFVDTRRFSQVRTPPAKPARALLFGNDELSAAELGKLENACALLGMELDKIGRCYGNEQSRPEVFLPDYDLVFAIGRCAVEALACGCAVITVVRGLAGQLVTPDNLDTWTYSNFSPRYFTCATQIGDDWLMGELRGYAPEAVARVSERIRKERDLRQAVDRLEELYKKAVREPPQSRDPSTIPEVAPYLEKIAGEVEVQISKLTRSAGKQKARCIELQRENEILRKSIDINTRRWGTAEARQRDGMIWHWVSSRGKRLKGAIRRLRNR